MSGEFARERAEEMAGRRRLRHDLALRTTSISVRLEHRKALDELAEREGTTLAALVREAIDAMLRGRRTLGLGGVTLGECHASRFCVWQPDGAESPARLDSIEFEVGSPPVFHIAVEGAPDGVDEGQ